MYMKGRIVLNKGGVKMNYSKLRCKKLKALDGKFDGVWIPIEILAINDLSNLEKMVLAEIKALDEFKGCYAMNSYFAIMFNKSKGRISKVISNLTSKKLITSKMFYNKGTKQIVRRELKIK